MYTDERGHQMTTDSAEAAAAAPDSSQSISPQYKPIANNPFMSLLRFKPCSSCQNQELTRMALS